MPETQSANAVLVQYDAACSNITALGSSEVPPMEEAAVGDEVAARDPKGTWYVARVADARGEGDSRELLVHYLGWKKTLDEWLEVASDRLQRVEDVEII